MYNWKPKNAEVNIDAPVAWAACDRCGLVSNIDKLVWQYAYQGSLMPQNTRFLVCQRHLDPLNPQDQPFILPPDPEPIYNARPYPYALEESSYLLTESGSIITTEGGTYIGTAIPNPGDVAKTVHLISTILAHGQSVSVLYLDLFNGNPLTVGASVLNAITGSATRTNIASQLTATATNIYQNLAAISVASASLVTTNLNYLAVYTTATGGTLLMSGPCAVDGPSVTAGAAIQFDALALTINTN